MKKQHLTIEQFGGYFLLLCVVILLMLLYKVLEIFIIDLILAAILSSVFFPLYKRATKITGQRKKLASFLTCSFIVFVILIPLSLFIYQFITEAAAAIQNIYTRVQNGALDPIIEWKSNGLFSSVREKLLPIIDLETIDLSQYNLGDRITESLTTTATSLGKQVTEFAKNVALVLFHFFIMIISMFFFFKDSNYIVKSLMHLSPLPTTHNENIVTKFKAISQATLFGIFLTAIIQGILGGIGFTIAGITNPIFWGTLMALFALIPFMGTFVIWGPTALYLIIGEHYAPGIFLLIWGGGVVSTIDNFLRPYFIHGRARTYPLFTFLSIIGGLSAFGLVGLILGPLILTLTFVFIEIYEIEYQGVLHQKDTIHKEKISVIQKLLKKLTKKNS